MSVLEYCMTKIPMHYDSMRPHKHHHAGHDLHVGPTRINESLHSPEEHIGIGTVTQFSFAAQNTLMPTGPVLSHASRCDCRVPDAQSLIEHLYNGLTSLGTHQTGSS